MKNLKTLIFFLFIFLTSLSLQAETYELDLDMSIAIAKMKSYDMLSLKQDLKIAEFNLKSATSRFKTHVDLNMTMPDYSKKISSFTDSIGNISLYTSRKGTYLGELTISQPLPTDGRVYISSGLNNIDNYISGSRTMTTSTRVGLLQPVNAFYYNDIRSGYKRAELAYEQSQKRLKREELNLVYNVSNAFYQLLSLQKREDIARMNLERQQAAYDMAKNKYDAGLIREVDALQMEVDLAEAQNNYDVSIVSSQASMNNFKEIIGISLHDSVGLSSTLDYEIVVVDAGKAVDLALNNRSEIREQEIRLEVNKIDIKRQKSYGMATGNITAYYEKIGTDEGLMTNQFSTTLNNTFDDFSSRPENFGVGFTVNIPIIDWGENRALVRAAEARLQQNMYQQEIIKRSIESEVLNLVADLNSSLKRLQLLEKNVSVAEKSFDITRARFSDGDIDSQALALERDRLNNAYTMHLSAYINYQLKLADLMRKTYYDFKNNQPVL
ncbi:MAG: TolC family protein [Prolixibacteraceae bacterium]